MIIHHSTSQIRSNLKIKLYPWEQDLQLNIPKFCFLLYTSVFHPKGAFAISQKFRHFYFLASYFNEHSQMPILQRGAAKH